MDDPKFSYRVGNENPSVPVRMHGGATSPSADSGENVPNAQNGDPSLMPEVRSAAEIHNTRNTSSSCNVQCDGGGSVVSITSFSPNNSNFRSRTEECSNNIQSDCQVCHHGSGGSLERGGISYVAPVTCGRPLHQNVTGSSESSEGLPKTEPAVQHVTSDDSILLEQGPNRGGASDACSNRQLDNETDDQVNLKKTCDEEQGIQEKYKKRSETTKLQRGTPHAYRSSQPWARARPVSVHDNLDHHRNLSRAASNESSCSESRLGGSFFRGSGSPRPTNESEASKFITLCAPVHSQPFSPRKRLGISSSRSLSSLHTATLDPGHTEEAQRGQSPCPTTAPRDEGAPERRMLETSADEPSITPVLRYNSPFVQRRSLYSPYTQYTSRIRPGASYASHVPVPKEMAQISSLSSSHVPVYESPSDSSTKLFHSEYKFTPTRPLSYAGTTETFERNGRHILPNQSKESPKMFPLPSEFPPPLPVHSPPPLTPRARAPPSPKIPQSPSSQMSSLPPFPKASTSQSPKDLQALSSESSFPLDKSHSPQSVEASSSPQRMSTVSSSSLPITLPVTVASTAPATPGFLVPSSTPVEGKTQESSADSEEKDPPKKSLGTKILSAFLNVMAPKGYAAPTETVVPNANEVPDNCLVEETMPKSVTTQSKENINPAKRLETSTVTAVNSTASFETPRPTATKTSVPASNKPANFIKSEPHVMKTKVLPNEGMELLPEKKPEESLAAATENISLRNMVEDLNTIVPSSKISIPVSVEEPSHENLSSTLGRNPDGINAVGAEVQNKSSHIEDDDAISQAELEEPSSKPPLPTMATHPLLSQIKQRTSESSSSEDSRTQETPDLSNHWKDPAFNAASSVQATSNSASFEFSNARPKDSYIVHPLNYNREDARSSSFSEMPPVVSSSTKSRPDTLAQPGSSFPLNLKNEMDRCNSTRDLTDFADGLSSNLSPAHESMAKSVNNLKQIFASPKSDRVNSLASSKIKFSSLQKLTNSPDTSLSSREPEQRSNFIGNGTGTQLSSSSPRETEDSDQPTSSHIDIRKLISVYDKDFKPTQKHVFVRPHFLPSNKHVSSSSTNHFVLEPRQQQKQTSSPPPSCDVPASVSNAKPMPIPQRYSGEMKSVLTQPLLRNQKFSQKNPVQRKNREKEERKLSQQSNLILEELRRQHLREKELIQQRKMLEQEFNEKRREMASNNRNENSVRSEGKIVVAQPGQGEVKTKLFLLEEHRTEQQGTGLDVQHWKEHGEHRHSLEQPLNFYDQIGGENEEQRQRERQDYQINKREEQNRRENETPRQQEHEELHIREREKQKQRKFETQQEWERNEEQKKREQLLRECQEQLRNEREEQTQREREEQQRRERMEQLWRELEELQQKEREEQLQREREEQLQREREEQLQREREEQLQWEREEQLQRKREEQLQREREEQLQWEREEQFRKKVHEQLQKKLQQQLRKEHEEALKKELEKLRREREEQLRKELEEQLRKELEEQLRKELEEQLRKEREEQLQKKREEKLQKKHLEQLQKELEEHLRKAREEQLRKERQERLRREREEQQQREREELQQREREEQQQREREEQQQRELEQQQQREREEQQQREREELQQREREELQQREREELQQREREELQQREREELQQREREELQQREREELQQREHEEQQQKEREAQQQREREEQQQREREQQQQRELEEQQQREREEELQREREEQQQKELEEQQQKELEEQQQREREEELQREREEQQQKELEEQQQKELEEQQQREREEQQQREREEQQQKEREEQQQKEREEEQRREREELQQLTTENSSISSSENVLLRNQNEQGIKFVKCTDKLHEPIQSTDPKKESTASNLQTHQNKIEKHLRLVNEGEDLLATASNLSNGNHNLCDGELFIESSTHNMSSDIIQENNDANPLVDEKVEQQLEDECENELKMEQEEKERYAAVQEKMEDESQKLKRQLNSEEKFGLPKDSHSFPLEEQRLNDGFSEKEFIEEHSRKEKNEEGKEKLNLTDSASQDMAASASNDSLQNEGKCSEMTNESQLSEQLKPEVDFQPLDLDLLNSALEPASTEGNEPTVEQDLREIEGKPSLTAAQNTDSDLNLAEAMTNSVLLAGQNIEAETSLVTKQETVPHPDQTHKPVPTACPEMIEKPPSVTPDSNLSMEQKQEINVKTSRFNQPGNQELVKDSEFPLKQKSTVTSEQIFNNLNSWECGETEEIQTKAEFESMDLSGSAPASCLKSYSETEQEKAEHQNDSSASNENTKLQPFIEMKEPIELDSKVINKLNVESKLPKSFESESERLFNLPLEQQRETKLELGEKHVLVIDSEKCASAVKYVKSEATEPKNSTGPILTLAQKTEPELTVQLESVEMNYSEEQNSSSPSPKNCKATHAFVESKVDQATESTSCQLLPLANVNNSIGDLTSTDAVKQEPLTCNEVAAADEEKYMILDSQPRRSSIELVSDTRVIFDEPNGLSSKEDEEEKRRSVQISDGIGYEPISTDDKAIDSVTVQPEIISEFCTTKGVEGVIGFEAESSITSDTESVRAFETEFVPLSETESMKAVHSDTPCLTQAAFKNESTTESTDMTIFGPKIANETDLPIIVLTEVFSSDSPTEKVDDNIPLTNNELSILGSTEGEDQSGEMFIHFDEFSKLDETQNITEETLSVSVSNENENIVEVQQLISFDDLSAIDYEYKDDDEKNELDAEKECTAESSEDEKIDDRNTPFEDFTLEAISDEETSHVHSDHFQIVPHAEIKQKMSLESPLIADKLTSDVNVATILDENTTTSLSNVDVSVISNSSHADQLAPCDGVESSVGKQSSEEMPIFSVVGVTDDKISIPCDRNNINKQENEISSTSEDITNHVLLGYVSTGSEMEERLSVSPTEERAGVNPSVENSLSEVTKVSDLSGPTSGEFGDRSVSGAGTTEYDTATESIKSLPIEDSSLKLDEVTSVADASIVSTQATGGCTDNLESTYETFASGDSLLCSDIGPSLLSLPDLEEVGAMSSTALSCNSDGAASDADKVSPPLLILPPGDELEADCMVAHGGEGSDLNGSKSEVAGSELNVADTYTLLPTTHNTARSRATPPKSPTTVQEWVASLPCPTRTQVQRSQSWDSEGPENQEGGCRLPDEGVEPPDDTLRLGDEAHMLAAASADVMLRDSSVRPPPCSRTDAVDSVSTSDAFFTTHTDTPPPHYSNILPSERSSGRHSPHRGHTQNQDPFIGRSHKSDVIHSSHPPVVNSSTRMSSSSSSSALISTEKTSLLTFASKNSAFTSIAAAAAALKEKKENLPSSIESEKFFTSLITSTVKDTISITSATDTSVASTSIGSTSEVSANAYEDPSSAQQVFGRTEPASAISLEKRQLLSGLRGKQSSVTSDTSGISGASYNSRSSLESLLESRRTDAVEVLMGLGFGGHFEDEHPLARIPARFLDQPSQVKGNDVCSFLDQENRYRQMLETNNWLPGLSYQGIRKASMTTSPLLSNLLQTFQQHNPRYEEDELDDLPPSARKFVSAVNQLRKQNRITKRSMSEQYLNPPGGMPVHRSGRSSVGSQPGSGWTSLFGAMAAQEATNSDSNQPKRNRWLSVLTPENRDFLYNEGRKSPETVSKRLIIGQSSFDLGKNGELLNEQNKPDIEDEENLSSKTSGKLETLVERCASTESKSSSSESSSNSVHKPACRNNSVWSMASSLTSVDSHEEDLEEQRRQLNLQISRNRNNRLETIPSGDTLDNDSESGADSKALQESEKFSHKKLRRTSTPKRSRTASWSNTSHGKEVDYTIEEEIFFCEQDVKEVPMKDFQPKPIRKVALHITSSLPGSAAEYLERQAGSGKSLDAGKDSLPNLSACGLRRPRLERQRTVRDESPSVNSPDHRPTEAASGCSPHTEHCAAQFEVESGISKLAVLSPETSSLSESYKTKCSECQGILVCLRCRVGGEAKELYEDNFQSFRTALESLSGVARASENLPTDVNFVERMTRLVDGALNTLQAYQKSRRAGARKIVDKDSIAVETSHRIKTEIDLLKSSSVYSQNLGSTENPSTFIDSRGASFSKNQCIGCFCTGASEPCTHSSAKSSVYHHNLNLSQINVSRSDALASTADCVVDNQSTGSTWSKVPIKSDKRIHPMPESSSLPHALTPAADLSNSASTSSLYHREVLSRSESDYDAQLEELQQLLLVQQELCCRMLQGLSQSPS
ncbi:hypothetical protein FHG87_010091 [Trinorchestia longiramus]|nr:hypothetical protein FHG87_010091 [Trinorchestia longiramus]